MRHCGRLSLSNLFSTHRYWARVSEAVVAWKVLHEIENQLLSNSKSVDL